MQSTSPLWVAPALLATVVAYVATATATLDYRNRLANRGFEGRQMRTRTKAKLGFAMTLTVFLGACETPRMVQSGAVQESAPALPATVRADQIVGRWGVASYQNPKDQKRTEVAARSQCKQPYVIKAGAAGGVIMHLADDPTPQDLLLKGSASGKNYIGPPGPAGGEKDREIVSVASSMLVTRFVNPDAATRYGNMIYVRCA
jgi:hypothetical protein